MTAYLFLAIASVGIFSTATSASAASMAEFGRCLASKGATFYGASWCPHCKSQRQVLGEAMSSVRYVECAVDGGRGATARACTSAGVNSYPTWVFGDGSRASGAQSIAGLAARTGCEPPSAGGGSGASTRKKSSGSAPPTGPRIIEVPQ